MPTSSPYLSNVTNSLDESELNHSAAPLDADPGRPLRFRQLPLWSSLRFKATAFAVVIGTLPILVLGTAGERIAARVTKDQIFHRQEADAKLLSDGIGQFMFERYGDIQVLAEQPIFADPRLRATTTVDDKERFLNAYQNAYGEVYDSVAFLDANGNDIAITGAASNHKNHKDDQYFQQAMTTDRPFIGQPKVVTGKASKQIYVSAPVKDSVSGNIVGVVRSRISVEVLENLMKDFEAVGELHFADATGTIFLSTEVADADRNDAAVNAGVNAETENEAEGEKGKEGAEISQHIGKDADSVFPELAQVRQNVRSAALQAVDALDQEVELLGYATVRSLVDMPDLGWFIIVENELEEALRVQQELRTIFFWGTLASILIVGSVAGGIANRAVRPIEATAAAVGQFGQGKFDSRLAVSGSDEVAILGTNVNRMADQIQGLLETLQRSTVQLGLQNNVLSELAQNEALIRGDVKATARAFTEAIAQTLGVTRAGIWTYSSDRDSLICLDQFDQNSGQHSRSPALYESEMPDYFQRLETEPLIVANDVQNHSEVLALLRAEPVAQNTVSFLNIPIQISGRTVGVVRCEQANVTRVWQADEQTFVTSIANLISIAMESELLQQEVSHLLDVVSDVEDGDLTIQANVSDRSTGLVADIFNRLIERLTVVLTQVVSATQKVSQTASQQKTMAEIVANNSEEQAQAVNQVLQLTERVEQVVQDSAEKVGATTTSLQTMQATVRQGKGAIVSLTEGITVLQEGSDRIVQQMKTLGEFVSLADQFVQDQSQIASLTQTLALNASLVAARASEQRDPRQFAVVAREFDLIANQVSRLAQQTNEGLVTLEQRSNQIHSVVSVIDGSVQNLGGLVKGFTQGVEQSNQVFNSVQAVTSDAVAESAAVTRANRDVVRAAQTAAQVVREIAAIATRTADLTQRTRIKSDEMDTLSNQLLQSIQFFQLPAQAEPEQDIYPNAQLTALASTTLTVGSVEIDADKPAQLQSSIQPIAPSAKE